MLDFFKYFVAPFIALALLYLLWAYLSSLWRERFPRYFKWAKGLDDELPKLSAWAIGIIFIIFLLSIFK